MTDIAPGPLAGVRVVDFTHVIAGPYCTMLLADAGAEVIKIEPPGGEYARVRGPRRTRPDGESVSAYGAAVSRGKKDVLLDLKNEYGRDIAEKLILNSDVVVENFSPGTIDRLGLGFSGLRDKRPTLITASISLWGSPETAGALAHRGGLSLVAESEGSLGYMVRDSQGRPVLLRVAIADLTSGLAAYGAIVTALLERQRSGVGQHLEIPMVRTMISFNSVNIAGAQMPRGEVDEGLPAGLGIFPARDGYVAIGVNTDKMWRRLAEGMGDSSLAEDGRFATYAERDRRVQEVNHLVSEWTQRHDADEIVELLAPTGLPCGRLNSPGDVLGDPKWRDLGWLWTIDDGLGGSVQLPANPIGPRFGGGFLPRLGQHTQEVVQRILEIDDAELARLSIEGAFGSSPAIRAP